MVEFAEESQELHAIQYVPSSYAKRQVRVSHRWKCSCGASSGGRWYRSLEEAMKAAYRHLDRASVRADADSLPN